MSEILAPGYLYWDGKKYITTESGGSGEEGPTGPTGIDGPTGTAGEVPLPIASQFTVSSVANTPGWIVISAFVYKAQTTSLFKAITLVSNSGLTVRLRLFGPIGGTAIEITNSIISSVSTIEELITSVDLSSDLIPGEIYQVQMECTGGILETDFSIVRFATLELS